MDQPEVVIFDESIKAERRYWLQQLAERPSASKLMSDFDPGKADAERGTTPVALDAATCLALDKLTDGSSFLLYTALLTALKICLHRYDGAGRVVVGSPALKDLHAENALSILSDVNGRMPFRQLLVSVRQTLLDAYDNQSYPHTYLLKDLDLSEDDPARLFDIVASLDDIHGDLPRLANNVTIRLKRANDGLVGEITFNQMRYRPETLQAFWAHIVNVLRQGIGQVDVLVQDVKLLSEAEERLLRAEVNATTAEFPRDACLHELFEAQVERGPQRTAVVFEGAQLSYGELNARANRFARFLRKLGVRENAPIGVFLERSVDMVVSLLAIAKAGAGYVPLDPAYPKERIAFMINDAEMPVLISCSKLASDLPATAKHVMVMDQAQEEITSLSDADLGRTARPSDLAYMIYTSGSTGAPKGVLLDHRGRVNNFTDFNRRFHIGEGDRLLSVSSLSFDMSAYDVFGTLAAGATLVLPGASEDRDPAGWARLIREAEITIWHSAPVLLDLMVKELEAERGELLRSLRLALLGGDWIPVTLPGRLKAVAPRVDVISLGGATEVSMDSIIYPVRDVDARSKSIPYGRPMANQTSYILDKSLCLTPIGVPGELHLGGAGVALGYWKRPGLTAEKFIPDPFASEPGGRLYKTGDVARYLPGGDIELLGRMDQQIKIRGLRIDLSEIEVTLRAHPEVQDCIVVARGDSSADAFLVAYVVSRAGMSFTMEAMRELLRQRLPEYMIPASLVALDAIPLTPNGKVDRKNLPMPRATRSDRRPFVAPRDNLERTVAERWAEILRVKELGIDDNFFELGGDSLKAMKACQVLGKHLPIVGLYKNPTVRLLCQNVLRRAATSSSRIHPLRDAKGDDHMSLVCVPYAAGNAIMYQPLADALSEGWSLVAVDLPGHELSRPDEELQQIEDTAAACVDEILRGVRGRLAVYGHCGGVAIATEIARLLEANGRSPEFVVLGGAFPMPEEKMVRGVFDPLDDLSDHQIHAFLQSLGGFEALDPGHLPFLMRAYRHDARVARSYISGAYKGEKRARVRAPLTFVVGDADPITAGYEAGHQGWELFFETVELKVLPEAGHYFVKYQASALADIISGATLRP